MNVALVKDKRAMQAKVRRDRALVIGGSMAGLVAARVLSDHFREVILVERDTLADTTEQRRGVPQGRHAHGILAGGRNALEGLFPGLFEDVMSAGALRADMTRDARWNFDGGDQIQFESDLEAVLVSRPLLERSVRRQVRKIPNVEILDGCKVDGLLSTSDNGRVSGVTLGAWSISADLVVDATGRGSRSAEWLGEMGYGRPKEETIEINIGYATRKFRRSPRHLSGGLFASIAATLERKRGGIIVAQEGDLWIVTLSERCGGTVPTDLAGFIEFAKTLSAPHIYDVISQAKPVGEAYSARFPASVRRRYEYMRRFPEGYLVLGDAISSFNPVYGQGMSVAALEAVELDRALEEGTVRLAQRFFAKAAKVVDAPWGIAAGNDLRMPGVAGRRTLMSRFMNWYVAKLHLGARTDPSMAVAFHKVTHLLSPPQSLLSPCVAARVLFAALSRRASKKESSGLGTAAREAA